MGGEREDYVPAKVEKQSAAQGREVVLVESRIRFHENNGEVHFHDDTNNLKVAVKSDVWYKAWTEITNQLKSEVKLLDCTGGNNELTVKVKEVNSQGGPIRDIELIISERSKTDKRVGSIYAALEKFTNPG